MRINDRIKLLIEKLEMDAKSFAKLIETNPSSISHLTSGRNKPSFDILQKIATKLPQVNIVWLLTGEGEIFQSETDNYVKQKSSTSKMAGNEQNNINQGVFAFVQDKKEEKTVIEKKEIDKIVLLYTDGSFKIYKNEDI